ncbi:hypothetical protein EVAR_9421_1 [Eumeta japonica]|uniref:Uncharacterized protein n=1 Tax=Eumeta variegata TaxID=151549 RepID=A0A4C1UCV3_EUMVA|nr:hypothetical protein EVAR_9421_1 [Eumeta japonica]
MYELCMKRLIGVSEVRDIRKEVSCGNCVCLPACLARDLCLPTLGNRPFESHEGHTHEVLSGLVPLRVHKTDIQPTGVMTPLPNLGSALVVPMADTCKVSGNRGYSVSVRFLGARSQQGALVVSPCPSVGLSAA